MIVPGTQWFTRRANRIRPEDRPQDWLPAYLAGGPVALDRLRRAHARLVAARDAFAWASGPAAVDAAIEQLQAAEEAYRRLLRDARDARKGATR